MTFVPDLGLVDLAIRQVVDCISYSNILPPWNETIDLTYDVRRKRIAQRLEEIASGLPIATPFTINVPSNGDRQRVWALPSVNDQIALHYVSLWLSKRMQSVTNSKVVHSYLINSDDTVAFVENQVHSWSRFQAATTDRGRHKYMLQIDLKSAFRSMSQKGFIDFFERRVSHTPETAILSAFLRTNGAEEIGVPLVNDSLFYLGNLYLSVVDEVVSRHCSDFIRFVDDYRIFFDSQPELDRAFSSLSKAIKDTGFEINAEKTRAGTVDDYLSATSGRTVKQTKGDRDYINPVIFSDTVDPNGLLKLLDLAVNNYDRYMTEGYGRLVVALIRKRILTTKIHESMTCKPDEKFDVSLGEQPALMGKLHSLLQDFLQRNDQTWRISWLLFVIAEMPGQSLKSTVEKIFHDKKLPPLVRLRAARILSNRESSSAEIEQFHDMGYLDEGQATTRTRL